MNLGKFDLNLLRVLDVLLEERNVTHAAKRLFVTQQAASGALVRLRRHFNDDLLVRVGRNLEPTPLAVSLIEPVRITLLAAQTALDTRPSFDPNTANRTYRLAMSDYGLLVLLPRFLRELTSKAPNVRCLVEPITEGSFEKVDRGDLDLCMTAHDMRLYGRRPSQRVRSESLFHDDFVCVIDRRHVDVGDTISLETYASLKHNSVVFGRGVETIVERAWAASGLDIHVAVKAPSFSALIFMLPGTPLVATAQRRLAEAIAPSLGLSVRECPLPIPSLQENVMWHERNEHDPAHAYLRQLIRRAAKHLD